MDDGVEPSLQRGHAAVGPAAGGGAGRWSVLSVLVQKEVAERLAAPPGTPACGAISVKVAFHATAAVVGVVPPTVFLPRPKVDSAIVRFERRAAPPVDVPSPAGLFTLARAGFAQRRKTLRQALRPVLGAGVEAVLAAAGIPALTRAEALTLEQWAALAEGRAVSRDVRVIARAKLTLSLRVLGLRPDGYHELEALVVSLRDPHDVVGLRIQAPFGVRVRLSGRAVAGVPADETNLAARAARLLLDAAADGEDPGPWAASGLDLSLHKTIPAGAGLGGGSADAAGTLVGGARLLGLRSDAATPGRPRGLARFRRPVLRRRRGGLDAGPGRDHRTAAGVHPGAGRGAGPTGAGWRWWWPSRRSGCRPRPSTGPGTSSAARPPPGRVPHAGTAGRAGAARRAGQRSRARRRAPRAAPASVPGGAGGAGRRAGAPGRERFGLRGSGGVDGPSRRWSPPRRASSCGLRRSPPGSPPEASRPRRAPAENAYLPAARRCQRVRLRSFLCFFFRMRLRRFLIREPMAGGRLAALCWYGRLGRGWCNRQHRVLWSP